jgi:YgiT-type zinc finger domain-containing protein
MGCAIPLNKSRINRKPNMKKCICGSRAKIAYVTEIGRIRDAIIRVTNVPVFNCNNCGESFMAGTDSVKFAKQVEIGIKNHLKQIDFGSSDYVKC